jgi:preprotein translocase subunit SecA
MEELYNTLFSASSEKNTPSPSEPEKKSATKPQTNPEKKLETQPDSSSESYISFEEPIDIQLINDEDSQKQAESDSESEVSLSALPVCPDLQTMQSDNKIYVDLKSEDSSYQGTVNNCAEKDGAGHDKKSLEEYLGGWEKGKKTGLGCFIKHQDARLMEENKIQPTEHQFGVWIKDTFSQGHQLKKIPLTSREPHSDSSENIEEIYYSGWVKSGNFHDSGELIIILKNKQQYKISGQWKQGKLDQILYNEIFVQAKKTESALLELLANSQSQLLFHLCRLIINKSIVHFSELVKAISASTLSLPDKFINLANQLNRLNSYSRAIVPFLLHSETMHINPIPAFKEKIANFQKDYKRALLRELNNPLYKTQNLPQKLSMVKESIAQFILDSEDIQLLQLSPTYLSFFMQLIRELQEASITVLSDKREPFLKDQARLITILWSDYLDAFKKPQAIVTEETEKTYIQCCLILYRQLLKVCNQDAISSSIESKLYKKLYKKQAGLIRDLLHSLKPEQFKSQSLINIPDRECLLFDLFEGNIDRQSTSFDLAKQIWIQLLYSIINELNNENFKALYEAVRAIISKSEMPAYESWRLLLNCMIDFILLYSDQQEVNQSLVKRQLGLLNGLQSLDNFVELLNYYISHHKNYSALNKLLNTAKKDFTGFMPLINQIHAIKKDMDSLITSLTPQKLESNKIFQHKKNYSDLNNFLLQIAGTNLDWILDEYMMTEFSMLPVSAITCINQQEKIYQYCPISLQSSIKHPSTKHYMLDTLSQIFAIKIKFNYELQNTDENHRQGQLILFKALAESLNFLMEQQLQTRSMATLHKRFTDGFKYIATENNSLEDLEQKASIIKRYLLFKQLEQRGIEDVLMQFTRDNALQPSDLANKNCTDILRQSYSMFKTTFDRLFPEILRDKSPQKQVLATIIKETKALALSENRILLDWNPQTRKAKLPELLARLAVIFSLQQSGYNKLSQFNPDIILAPHCIQILGILTLSGITSQNKIQSQIAQILTGQGKSWTLALTGSLLALTGHDVTIVCYNESLNNRDAKIMRDFFSQLSIQIPYKTFQEMSWGKITVESKEKINYGLGKLANAIIDLTQAKQLEFESTQNSNARSVLLIDEVDVLFSDLYGDYLGTCYSIPSELYGLMQKKIWKRVDQTENIDQLDQEALKKSIRYKFPMKEDPILYNSSFFNTHLNFMVRDAVKVKKGIRDQDFQLNYLTSQIELKGDNGLYKINLMRGYENCFQFLKRSDKENYGSPRYHAYGYLSIQTGVISYAEIPKQFPLCLGVSGSLEHLTVSEKEVLKQYDICRLTYYPSFWGSSRLEFNKESAKHYLVAKTTTQWYEIILQNTKEALTQNRAVLIFFDTIDSLMDFYQGPAAATLPNLKKLTLEISETEREMLINTSSGQSNTVTLVTREFGRGEDFQASTEVAKNGGIHVIQTFLSLDIKEEIQIRGRTARKSERGSYALFPCLEDLIKFLNLADLNLPVPYDKLNTLRNNKYEADRNNLKNKVEKTMKKHNDTISFLNSTLSYFSLKRKDQTGEFRTQILEKLETLQHF